jgi:hypothetical protein
MKAIAFDPEDFELLSQLRQKLHNAQRSMTFDEQRDYAERFRLLLERAVEIDV